MPWNAILIAASGAGAALLTVIVIRDVRARKVSSAIVFAALFVTLGVLAHILLFPKFQHPAQQKIAKEFLKREKLFSLVAADNSKFKDDYIDYAVDQLQKTKSREQAFNSVNEWAKRNVAPYFFSYIQHASDKALYDFATYFGRVLTQINQRDPQACVTWMYGLSSKDESTGKAIEEAVHVVGENTQMSVMTEIVETAKSSPVTVEGTDSAKKAMKDFVDKLTTKYGKRFKSGLEMSAKPGAKDNNRADMCFAVEKLYSEIAVLPVPKRKIILRNMFATSS